MFPLSPIRLLRPPCDWNWLITTAVLFQKYFNLGCQHHAAQLAADIGGQDGIAIYNDLGSGTFYGEFAPTPSDGATVLDIRLNQAAINHVNAARTGSGKFYQQRLERGSTP
jgi:hypothetical protein